MRVLEGVKGILRAIPAIAAEEVRLDEKHGIERTTGLQLFDAASTIRLLEINQEAEKLKAYLGTIEYETLLKIQALMYFGRDRDATFPEKLDALRGRKAARMDIIRTILEKVPVCGRYFTEAVERLWEEGVELDSL